MKLSNFVIFWAVNNTCVFSFKSTIRDLEFRTVLFHSIVNIAYKLCSYYLNIIYMNRKVMQWYVLMSVALIWMIIDEWVYQLQNITNFANFLSNLINIPCDKQPSTSANRKCIRQWQENIIKDIIHTSIPNIE